MAKYEATQAQWKRIAGELPGAPTAELPAGDELPVGNVNFAEAEGFCSKLIERACRRPVAVARKVSWLLRASLRYQPVSAR